MLAGIIGYTELCGLTILRVGREEAAREFLVSIRKMVDGPISRLLLAESKEAEELWSGAERGQTLRATLTVKVGPENLRLELSEIQLLRDEGVL